MAYLATYMWWRRDWSCVEMLVSIKAKLKVNVLLTFSKYLVGAKYGQEEPQS